MSLIKNSLLNFAGFLIPALIAIPVLGILARILEVEAFGLFLIVYAIIGYAGIFDGGLTRAVIRFVSIHRDDLSRTKKIVGTSASILFFVGITIGLIIFLLSDSISNVIKLNENLDIAFQNSIIYISLCIPVFLLGLVFQSFFDGVEKFKHSNFLKILSNSLLSIFPLIGCLLFNTVEGAIIGLFYGRVCGMLIGYLLVFKSIGYFSFKIESTVLKELLSYGSWLTISNVVSPIMVYFDRFIISSALGQQSVAFYAAPSEAVNRLLNIPGSISRALFPFISNSKESNNHDYIQKKAFILTFIVTVILSFPFFIFAEKIILLWVGEQYVESSSIILKVLLVGFVFNSLAQIPFSVIQAKGHSKIAAFVHLIELPFYLALIFIFINEYGLVGASYAWTLRVAFDFFIFYKIEKKLRHEFNAC